MAKPLIVKLQLDSADFDKGLATATATVQKADGAFASMGKQVLSMAAGYISARAAIGFFRTTIVDSVKASLAQEEAVNALNSALRTAGEFTPKVSREMQEFASQTQRSTRFQDDAVLSTQALLVTYGVAADRLRGATQATLDFAAATGKDLQSAAAAIGRAIGGSSDELGRFGVNLDLKTVPAAERARVVIQALNEQFGGRAQADAATLSGQIDKLRNAYGELQEKIGDAITKSDFFRNVLNGLEVLTRRLDAAMGDSTVEIQANAGTINDLSFRLNLLHEAQNEGVTDADLMREEYSLLRQKLQDTAGEYGVVTEAGFSLGASTAAMSERLNVLNDAFNKTRDTAREAGAAIAGVGGGGPAAPLPSSAELLSAQDRMAREFQEGHGKQVQALQDRLKTEVQLITERFDAERDLAIDAHSNGLLGEQQFAAVLDDIRAQELEALAAHYARRADMAAANEAAEQEALFRRFEAQHGFLAALGEEYNLFHENQVNLSAAVAETMQTTFVGAFQQVEGALTNAIFTAVKGGKDIQEIWKNAADAILKSMIGALVRIAAQFIVSRLIGDQLLQSEAQKTVPMAALNALKSMAGAPFPINLTAPAFSGIIGGIAAGLAGAVGSAGGAAGGLLGAKATGDDNVAQTGPYLLHRGERVVPEQTNRDLTEFLRRTEDRPGGQTSVNIAVGEFVGDDEAADRLATKVLEAIQLRKVELF